MHYRRLVVVVVVVDIVVDIDTDIGTLLLLCRHRS